MKTYTLHLPAAATRGDPIALERAVVVPDGFSWAAFAFAPFWFVWHRLWLAAALVTLLLVGLVFGGRVIGLSPGAGFLVLLLAAILIGLEASSLRRWTYARNERPARDAVIAGSRDDAEAKAFARWLGHASSRTPSSATGARTRDDHGGVIGLFPASEGAR